MVWGMLICLGGFAALTAIMIKFTYKLLIK